MERVEITRRMVNIFTMQVCAADDASDEEILRVCNQGNMAGTENGWTTVIRTGDGDDEKLGREKNKEPVPCQAHAGRTHFLVLC